MNVILGMWRWLNDTCPECGEPLDWTFVPACGHVTDEGDPDDDYVGRCAIHGEVR